jgi:UPF0716 protein FxsA
MGFGRILFLVFLAVPLIEIALFVLIGNAIGLWPTLLGVLVTAIIGSVVLRIQGMAVFNDIRGQMGRGEIPGRALADAAMIGAGGLMLLLPGYFSDLIGILLLLPPTRAVVYGFLKSRISFVAMSSYSARGPAPGTSPRQPPDDPGTINLDSDDWRRR